MIFAYIRYGILHTHVNVDPFRIVGGASKRLVELLQMLSCKWKIDQDGVGIYHVYSKHGVLHNAAPATKYPAMQESCPEDVNVCRHPTLPSRGEFLQLYYQII